MIPIPVVYPATSEMIEIWKTIYEPSRGTSSDKTIEESLWRRNQDEKNSQQSGWKSSFDKRRKLFYYQYRYNLIEDENCIPYIALTSAYIYISLSLPQGEIDEYQNSINKSAKHGGWNIIKKSFNSWEGTFEDLHIEVNHFSKEMLNPEDPTTLPENYSSLEIVFRSLNFEVTSEIKRKPWSVLASGMRKKIQKGNPFVTTDISVILDYLPAQLEIGCGPAYEAGVPALHDLHYLYSINDPFTKSFILSVEKDSYLSLLFENPLKALSDAVSLFSRILSAPVTEFYSAIAELYEKRHFVGSIITNNFDGIHLRFGIPEIFVRRYEDDNIAPSVSFHPDAKSLIVVGCHADRRGIQEQARAFGLKVIIIDPEGWFVEEKFIKYPLEAQDENDIIINETASSALRALLTIVREHSSLQ